MDELNVAAAILSVPTPGTAFRPDVARELNDCLPEVVAAQPDQLGFLATVRMPHFGASVDEVARSLDELHAGRVMLLATARAPMSAGPARTTWTPGRRWR
ncbi:hypothetical protein [Mycobacterium sp. 050134]|uniref:hypothetical protein n=1 Tax=Mycobacterium sp. 050134 TaxID=3096111 RepID=UPI002EDB619C